MSILELLQEAKKSGCIVSITAHPKDPKVELQLFRNKYAVSVFLSELDLTMAYVDVVEVAFEELIIKLSKTPKTSGEE